MKLDPKAWGWSEGTVDRINNHIELRYGSAETESWDEWIPVALVGRPIRRKFPVQFLISQGGDPRYADIIRQVKQELDFYLVEKGESDPWAYAQYHCGTSANAYGQIHWSYFPKVSVA